MPAGLIALLVFVVVALLAFGMGSILDQRNARARLIKERLANERKAPELAPDEELALLRDEQLSQIPALDNILRRSERVTDIQKMLAQAGMATRAGNFLGISVLSGVVATFLAYGLSKRVEVAWVAMLVGFVLPYAYASYRRNKRFEKFEELFPEAIDTLARAVRAGGADAVRALADLLELDRSVLATVQRAFASAAAAPCAPDSVATSGVWSAP